MTMPKRSSPVQMQNTAARDMKQRVICSLNKLSDRDTHSMACLELESIVQNLAPESFSSFLSCIYSTDSSHKLPVRRQSVRLLGLMAAAHGDDLAPFLPRMVGSAIVHRLRDSDSAMRTACVEAVVQMASRITRPPFSVLLKPLSEALLLEQDLNSQMGAALCLVAAIESSPTPDVAQLRQLLPRLLKLLRTPSFKAKAALLSLIGCTFSAGAAHDGLITEKVVSSLEEFLTSEDWAARKAAADALARLALSERGLLSELKSSCLKSFEARRFDKVKAVREAMNRLLHVWRDVPDVSDNLTPPSELKSSLKDNTEHGHFPAPCSGSDMKSLSTKIRDSPLGRSNPVGNERKPNSKLLCKMDRVAHSDWNVDITIPNDVPVRRIRKDEHPVRKGIVGRFREQGEGKNNQHLNSNLEAKHSFFDNKHDDRTHKFGGSRSSRVVPVDESSETAVQPSIAHEDLNGRPRDSELSLIRKQLVQIQTQQSSLLNLLQTFIGNSQNGMRFLETRVESLEAALDGISYDLAVSTGRMGGTNTAGNACFKLPGADFLSSKLWRRTEGRYGTSRFSSSNTAAPLAGKGTAECSPLHYRRFGLNGGIVPNPLADIHPGPAGLTDSGPKRLPTSEILREPCGRQPLCSDRPYNAASLCV